MLLMEHVAKVQRRESSHYVSLRFITFHYGYAQISAESGVLSLTLLPVGRKRNIPLPEKKDASLQ